MLEKEGNSEMGLGFQWELERRQEKGETEGSSFLFPHAAKKTGFK